MTSMLGVMGPQFSIWNELKQANKLDPYLLELHDCKLILILCSATRFAKGSYSSKSGGHPPIIWSKIHTSQRISRCQDCLPFGYPLQTQTIIPKFLLGSHETLCLGTCGGLWYLLEEQERFPFTSGTTTAISSSNKGRGRFNSSGGWSLNKICAFHFIAPSLLSQVDCSNFCYWDHAVARHSSVNCQWSWPNLHEYFLAWVLQTSRDRIKDQLCISPIDEWADRGHQSLLRTILPVFH